MAVDVRSFKNALGCFASGVTVITTTDSRGAPVGVTVSAFSSLSLSPPLVLFCLDAGTMGLDAYMDGHVAINILEENQRELSIRFAGRSAEKFEGLKHDVWEGGCPVLKGCLANLGCIVERVIEAGDHFIIIAKVERAESKPTGQPLVYFSGGYMELGDATP